VKRQTASRILAEVSAGCCRCGGLRQRATGVLDLLPPIEAAEGPERLAFGPLEPLVGLDGRKRPSTGCSLGSSSGGDFLHWRQAAS